MMREIITQLITAGHEAWLQGLLSGYSGNLSTRIGPDAILVTAAGSRKGFLGPDDFCLVDNQGSILRGAKASSELSLHLAIYGSQPQCRAILHTHPPHLQALELAGDFSPQADLFEADFWLRRLVVVPAWPPGDERLGQSCVEALSSAPASLPRGAWLRRHGLCALGKNIQDCLALTEEMEHLAKVRLLAASMGNLQSQKL